MGSDETAAELVKISEEFTNTDSLLRAAGSDSSDHIVQVFGAGAGLHGLVSGNTGVGLWVEVPRVVEISADSE